MLDSYNLLAAGIRQALRQLADKSGETVKQVAQRLDLRPYLDRGIKGKAAVDWSSQEGPRQVLAQPVEDAERVRAEIERVLKQESGAAAVGASPPVAPDSPMPPTGPQNPEAPAVATTAAPQPHDLAQPSAQDLAQPSAQVRTMV